MSAPTEQSRQPGAAFSLATLLLAALIVLSLAFLLINFLKTEDINQRQAECANNMRQLSTAIYSYDATHNRLPGYLEVEFVDGVPRKRPCLWELTPLLERQDLYDFSRGYAGDGLRMDKEPPFLPLLSCPSNPIFDKPINNYVLNTGLPDGKPSESTPADWPDNGVFHSSFPLNDAGAPIATTVQSSAWISGHDGTSTTVWVSESLVVRPWFSMDETQVGFVWHPTLDPPWIVRMESAPIAGHDPYELARPSSNHEGLVNAVFCDNHVQSLSKKIDYRVYCQLLAPHESGVRPAGANPSMKIPAAIMNTPLTTEY